MLKTNQYLKNIQTQSEHCILIATHKLANTNMIIIVPRTFKMSTIYLELGKEILLILQKHSWAENLTFWKR